MQILRNTHIFNNKLTIQCNRVMHITKSVRIIARINYGGVVQDVLRFSLHMFSRKQNEQ